MTPDDLAAIRKRAEAANDDIGVQYRIPADEWLLTCDKPTMEMLRHAVTDVPTLLAEVERLTTGWGKEVRIAENLADKVTDLEYERDALAVEAKRLRDEAELYRAAICFETTCTNCARLLNRMIGLEAERDALTAKIARVRSAIRLISPDHITPQGVRILNAALADPKEA